MGIAKTAVVLMLESGAMPPQPSNWYRKLFLSTSSGVGAYWFKQSNGGISFEGDVFGWNTFGQTPNWDDSASLFAGALDSTKSIVDIESDYDVCIIFIARVNNAGTKVGQSSHLPVNVTPQTQWKRLSSHLVLDTNSRFDICAHEIGHALNLAHSFDDTESQYEPWKTSGGEYGHPYCVMAAGTYGGAKSPPVWTPPLPELHPLAQERIPPSLNGWYARLAGWVKSIDWSVGDNERNIEIESLGSWPSQLPKVIHIRGVANEYSVEYRDKRDYFDSGLASSAIVVNHGLGGRAYRAQGGGATFLGAIELPLHFNRLSSVYSHPAEKLALEVLDWKGSSVVLRLSGGPVKPRKVLVDVTTEVGAGGRQDIGDFDFTNSGVDCVTGIWHATRLMKSQLARLTLTLPDWPQPFLTRWWIDDQELIGPSGNVSVLTEVESPLPLPKGNIGQKTVHLSFTLKGSDEILLSNVPGEGNYSVNVRCTAGMSVGQFDATTRVDFEGEEVQFYEILRVSSEDRQIQIRDYKSFKNAYHACLIHKRDLARPQRVHHIVIPEMDLPRPQVDEPGIQHILSALERADRPLADPFSRQAFSELTGYPARRARIVPVGNNSLSDLTSRNGFVSLKPHHEIAGPHQTESRGDDLPKVDRADRDKLDNP